MKTMRPLLVAAFLGLGATSVAAAQGVHLGARLGYNFDRDDASLGAQVMLPITSVVDFYPSADIYFADVGSAFGINADLKWRMTNSPMYLGGGLNMMRTSVGGDNNMNTGGNLIVGVESLVGQAHPFFEVRAMLREQSSVQIVGGLNFTLR